ncbi:hypothetical protein KJ877_01500 [bacterium]|nr:hypothetical protein [bacterium]MBU1989938.1 hypothetical protein [bacterium]
MFSVNRDFAPPFKLIAPYFIIGVTLYLVSTLFAFSLDISASGYMDPSVIAWVHLFLLGFVMMVILGAMAQLIPVVLENGHFAVDLYYIIWPLLLAGALLMACGFIYSAVLLPFGGLTVLLAMLIFLLDTLMTIKKVKAKLNFAMTSIIIANVFLLSGIILGIILALGYAGIISVNLNELVKGHLYLLVGGYVIITIYGLSMVLLPMFGLSHHFSSRPIKIALFLMTAAVVCVTTASILELSLLSYIGYLLAAVSLLFYLYQNYILYKTRARKEHDIYIKSLYVSNASLIASLVLGVVYIFSADETLLFAIGWLTFTGFFGFIITAHLYKIVPFLIWFERFSPLVGKQKVPMLADMLPLKGANAQLYFSAIGVFLATYGLLFASNDLFRSGISCLCVGNLFLLQNIIYIIRFK